MGICRLLAFMSLGTLGMWQFTVDLLMYHNGEYTSHVLGVSSVSSALALVTLADAAVAIHSQKHKARSGV